MNSRSGGFPPPHSSSGRSSSRRFNESRSTSRARTPSNKSINFEKFLEPPQKNVTASSWFATKAFTLACDLTRDAGLTVGRGRWSWKIGLASQAALAVLGGLFLGFVAGFLIAGWRTAGPEDWPL